MLLMRLYIIKAGTTRFLIEMICFNVSMICLSFALSRLNWAMEQTVFQMGCILAIVPIVFSIVKDIQNIRLEK